MKIRLLLFTLISALALAPAGLRAADDEDQTELGAKMEKMGGAWRRIKAQVSDASKNDDTLTKLGTMKENLSAALKLEPETAKSKSGAEKAKFVSEFHARIQKEIDRIDKITAAVKAGNNADAAKLVGEVDHDYKDAHKTYKKPKKK